MKAPIPARYFSRKYPIQYYKIEKSGCTYLANLIYYIDNGKYYSQPVLIHEADYFLGNESFEKHEYFNFSFVRNPVRRFISLYKDKCLGHGPTSFPYLSEKLTNYYGADFSPEHYGDLTQQRKNIKALLAYIKLTLSATSSEPIDPHWAPQTDLLNTHCQNNQINFIGLLERVNSGINKILNKIGIIVPDYVLEKHINESSILLDEYHILDRKILDDIFELYEDDFKEFGYLHQFSSMHGKQTISTAPKTLRAYHFFHVSDDEICYKPVDNTLAISFAERGSHQAPHAVLAKAATLKSLGFYQQAYELLNGLCSVDPEELLFLHHFYETTESPADAQQCKQLLEAYLLQWPHDHWAWNLLGKILQTLDKPDKVSHAFVKAIELAPIQPWHHYDFSEFLIKQDDLTGALIHARRCSELAPGHWWLYEKCADLALRTGIVDEARATFQTTCQLNPNAPWPHYHLADFLTREGSHIEALVHAQQAAWLLPDRADIQEFLGNIALRAGALDTARTAFAKTCQLCPDASWPHYHLADLLSGDSQIADALYHAQQAARLLPNHAEVFERLGNTALRAGEPDIARAAFADACRLNPDAPWPHYHLTDFCAQADEDSKAFHHAQQAARLLPDYAELHERLGNAALRIGELDTARAAFADACRLNPNAPWPHYHLTDLCARYDEDDTALHHAQQAARLLPDYAELHERLGNTALRIDELDTARNAFAEACRLNPDFAWSHYYLAELLVRKNQITKAFYHAQQAAQRLPDHAEVQECLGNSALHTGALDIARDAYAEACRLNPDAPWPHYHLTDLLIRAGESDKAFCHVQQAARLMPDCANAAAKLATVALASGSKRLAATALAKAEQLAPERRFYGYPLLLKLWAKSLLLVQRIH